MLTGEESRKQIQLFESHAEEGGRFNALPRQTLSEGGEHAANRRTFLHISFLLHSRVTFAVCFSMCVCHELAVKKFGNCCKILKKRSSHHLFSSDRRALRGQNRIFHGGNINAIFHGGTINAIAGRPTSAIAFLATHGSPVPNRSKVEPSLIILLSQNPY